jgi:hypothetical protein
MCGAKSMHEIEEKCIQDFRKKIIREYWKDIEIYGKIILECVETCGLHSSCTGLRPVAGCCEHGNET